MTNKEIDKIIENLDKSISAFKVLWNDYQSCKLELCRLCQRQKIFTNDWCKECRWSDNNNNK